MHSKNKPIIYHSRFKFSEIIITNLRLYYLIINVQNDTEKNGTNFNMHVRQYRTKR